MTQFTAKFIPSIPESTATHILLDFRTKKKNAGTKQADQIHFIISLISLISLEGDSFALVFSNVLIFTYNLR